MDSGILTYCFHFKDSYNLQNRVYELSNKSASSFKVYLARDLLNVSRHRRANS